MKILLLLMMCLSFSAFSEDGDNALGKDCEGVQDSSGRVAGKDTAPKPTKEDAAKSETTQE